MDLILLGQVNIVAVLITVVIGAIAGWLAGTIMKGGSLGLVPNIVVGVIGAFLFSYLFGSLHLIDMAYVNEIVAGTLGAMLLLFGINVFKKVTAKA
jgi:uncharacterized membrane protein YeaQ/YmgE (transglycosylase-associated protein family)